MARVDFFDDPSAPRATTRIPGASAAVRDERGRLLLIRREDTGQWALPGGIFELDETIAECAVRETREEAGVEIAVTGLVGIYTDPRHVALLDDGRAIQPLGVCFHARPVGGEARPDGVETTAVAWVEPERLGEYELFPTHRERIADALSGSDQPRLA
ncbi:NUDIX domain-containing protein [Actinomycetospora sp. OC33-EN08]|uniref:NUDIX domain-containing protein n=1 Tax=Actinomycetospora aurantiaca TaxID=3129233 RepID=A0ABU8MJ33_9PSEU